VKITLSDRNSTLHELLALYKTKNVIPYDRRRIRERVSTISCVTLKHLHELDLRVLFDYQMFPENILSSACEWRIERRPMQVGDTILQQINIPPLQALSLRILVATRVCEIIDLPHRKGFSYEALEGHVEKGISTFTVEQQAGAIVASIHTLSAPGSALTTVIGPFFSIPYQAYCTKQALRRMQLHIEQP
jgi:uncharacterized protein (UPF0548 family)